MRLALYEDHATDGFAPLVLMRPVFELVCGRHSVRERWLRWLQPDAWGAFTRREIAELYAEEQPRAVVNDFQWLKGGPTLLVNGRWLPDAAAAASIRPDDVGVLRDEVVYLTLDPDEVSLLTEETWNDTLARIARTRRFVPAEGRLLSRPWDLVDENGPQLERDFGEAPDAVESHTGRSVVGILGDPERVRIDADAEVEPYVVLDVRQGPVSIDSGAVLQAFTRVEGPCHIGRHARLFRANVRAGTTIGPHCRVGGEVEASILHGHVNKYHDGFLGHAYVCPWVNLGALSTNSDLKNDYSHVRVPLDGAPVDSGRRKVGCFLGDHTKTALGSLFNTGSSVGVMCTILPGGELLPKHVPSFCRIWHGQLDDGGDLERNLQTARTVLQRRERRLTPAAERRLRALYDETAAEREAALLRARERRAARESASLPFAS